MREITKNLLNAAAESMNYLTEKARQSQIMVKIDTVAKMINTCHCTVVMVSDKLSTNHEFIGRNSKFKPLFLWLNSNAKLKHRLLLSSNFALPVTWTYQKRRSWIEFHRTGAQCYHRMCER